MRDLEIRGAGNLLGDEQSGHVAALGFELYMQMLDEAVRASRAGERAARSAPSRCASTSTSTPTCRPTTSPTSRRRSTSTAGSPAAREVADLERLREELEDRFGPVPEPLENLLAAPAGAHQARPGRRARRQLPRRPPRGHADRARLAAAPSALREEMPEALYESGQAAALAARARRAGQRFPAVVRAADALLAVSARPREPDDCPRRADRPLPAYLEGPFSCARAQ